MSFVAVAIGAAVVGGAVKYAGARKNELKANDNHRKAKRELNAASAALAAAEAESMVPGFGDSTNIPGYKRGTVSGISQSSISPALTMSPAQQRNLDRRDRALGRPIPQQLGAPQNRPAKGGPVFEPFGGDDVGDEASRTIIQSGANPKSRAYQEAIKMGYDPATGVSTSSAKAENLKNELLKRRFEEVTASLPKTPIGLPIFPDPETKEGKDFYAKLPKSIADMATNPNMAQMYKGSNIVNPYANVRDISGIAEDVSDLIKDRSDLIKDRTDLIQDRTDLLSNRADILTDRSGMLSDRSDLIQDRTGLLSDRSGLFESAAPLGADLSGEATDLSTALTDLSTGQEDLSRRIVDLRPGAQDFSGLATDTSILASNAFANLQVATQAADLQAQQSDQALANTLSTIRATGAGAGGATAIAQAALQSKLNISATIEQQEARNVQARAQGQQQIEQIRMSESKRLQDIALGERLRLENLRQSEGLRIDETRLQEGRRLQELGISEGRRLQDFSISEGRRLQELGISEGRRLQELNISEALREQGLTLDEALRLQQAQFDTAREQDRIKFDEAGRLQEAKFSEAGRLEQARFDEAGRLQTAAYDAARERDRIRFDETGRLQQTRFDEAGRLQEARANEQIRLQDLRMAEQQRLQQADAMAREFQFGIAETREQNRLNRLQDMQTQAMQTTADLEAAKLSARATRQGALASGLTGVASAAISATD